MFRNSLHRLLSDFVASRSVGLVAGICLLVLGIPGLPSGAEAQTPDELRRQAEQILGRPLTNQEILQYLQQSGYTPAEIRDLLEAQGYDRSAADDWLDVLDGRSSRVPEGTSARPLLDVIGGGTAGRGTDSGAPLLGRRPTTRPLFLDRPPDQGTPVFGREVFRQASSQFQPVTTGPVPPDYRVGPGDELVLVLTGAVEQAYELTVSREGWIVIPEVGRVVVSGRTMDQLRETLLERLSQSYSSLQGPDPATRMDLTIGSVRSNQIFVVGEVEMPGAYTVSSLHTALSALYFAQGPKRNGSFRRIEVNRGDETVRVLDLYDYLLNGRAENDVRLENGDVVFVPVAGPQVEIQGPVARPGIYELRDGEGLRTLVRYAGGVQPDAMLARVQIRRILPPAERAPGVERAVLDIPVGDLEPGGEDVRLREGDRINVFAVLDEARNEVTVTGGVWRPGTYGAADSTRVWDVIESAGGLLPDAYQGRAQIQRLREDYTREMIPVSLARGPDGGPVENPLVRGMDQVIIYAERGLREDRAVSIGGWVRTPGVYPYVDGMTVADLILQAGGLRTGAFIAEAEVARLVVSQEPSQELTRRYTVALDSTLVFERNGPAVPSQADLGQADEFTLRNLDAVYVRKAPGFEPQRRVVVSGEVLFPGPYSLQTRTESLTSLIDRAGGLTGEAYAQGLQLWRAEPGETGPDTLTAAQIAGQATGSPEIQRADTANRRYVEADSVPPGAQVGDTIFLRGDTTWVVGRGRRLTAVVRPRAREAPPIQRTLVGVDFTEALEEPEGSQNIFVEPGDSIYVPRYIPTVDVRGAVGVPTKVLYREGEGLDYYVDRAGGYAENADEDRVRIRFANGELATRGRRFLFFGGGIPDPDPGSIVTVPQRPPEPPGAGLNSAQWATLATSVLGSIVTIVVALN